MYPMCLMTNDTYNIRKNTAYNVRAHMCTALYRNKDNRKLIIDLEMNLKNKLWYACQQ